MTKQTSNYSKDDKFDIIMNLLQNPSKAAEIAKKYNLGISTLYKWRNRFLEGARQELDNYKTGPKLKSKPSLDEQKLNKENMRLKAKVDELACENEILKKKENYIGGPLL